MVEVSKPVNLGQLSAELGGVALWSSGPDASGVTTVWGEVDSAALAGAVAVACRRADAGHTRRAVRRAVARRSVGGAVTRARARAKKVRRVKVAGAIPAVPDAPGGQGTQAVQVAALRAQVAALTATVRALAAAVDALDDEEQTRADAVAAIAARVG